MGNNNEKIFSLLTNKTTIYNTIFIDIQTVLEAPTLEMLTENKDLFDVWTEISEKNGLDVNSYLTEGIKYHELQKIVLITVGFVKLLENGEMGRELIRIKNSEEKNILIEFFGALNGITINNDFSVCGFELTNNKLPFLFKKYFQLKNGEHASEIPSIPPILGNFLIEKPWNSNIIDIDLAWSFTGKYSNTSNLNIISSFLGLKKNVNIVDKLKINEYYYNGNLKEIAIQSSNVVNLCIQFMRLFRL